jgi:hypothetical protein
VGNLEAGNFIGTLRPCETWLGNILADGPKLTEGGR